MRLEIIIPDGTRPDLIASLRRLTKQLSAQPELVEDIRIADDEDAAIQALFTPELLAEIDAADADMKAGNGRTMAHLNAKIAETRARWLDANPS